MITPKFIDIIIPAKDCAHFIKPMLEKLSKQTNQDFNVIYVDDGSSDNTILEFYKQAETYFKDRYLFLQHERNKGPGTARNTGAHKAVSEFIWFIDADDSVAADDVIECVHKELENRPDLQCICLGYTAVKKNNIKKIFEPETLDEIGGYPCWATAAWAKVIKRELVVDFPEDVLVEDVPWWFKQCDQFDEDKVTIIPKKTCILYNNLNPGASSRTAEYLYTHFLNLETLAVSDILESKGLNDRWVLDYIKNLANLYELKHILKHENVKRAWKIRFHQNWANLLNGSYVA